MAAEPLSPDLGVDEFSALLSDRFSSALTDKIFAVGLSGGPDSMVLTRLLSEWAARRGDIQIHAITVDHGLRPESAEEARKVADWVRDWPHVTHTILHWTGEKPEKRIQEEARNARYDLMGDYCSRQGIKYLFLAHHQDDQAETFLLRLAMGSGLDGLAAMRPLHSYSPQLILLRPFLGFPKERLLAAAAAKSIPFVNDPSNKSDNFARARLRKSLSALEAEGLTSKRLAVTSERLERARTALDIIAEKAQKAALVSSDTGRTVYKFFNLQEWPDEVILRVLIQAMKGRRAQGEHLPRMEKIESLFRDLMATAPFTKRTLGGLIFERDDREGLLIISLENTPPKSASDMAV